jgi:glycosyltransferase involved in cell wall biosynthesis
MSNLTTHSLSSPRPRRLQQHLRLEHLERVALVTGNYNNVADGASQTLHRIVDSLTERGVEVAVVAPGDGDQLPPPPLLFEVPSIPMPVQGYQIPLGLGRRARDQLERFDPQLVHVSSPELASLMAMRFAQQRDLPVTSSFHTNFASYLKYWGLPFEMLTPVAWKLLEWFYAPCEQVFVPTDSMGEVLVEHGVLDDWAILARGVDPAQFSPHFRSMDWRRRRGIGVDEVVVLFCTRLVWEKGLRTLVGALERLRDEGPAHHVVIAGDGDQQSWLEEKLPHATFTGYVVGRELARTYASSDIFVYPSTTDTFGNVTLEAMASQLPVIGASAPGTRSLVDNGQSGLLVEPDDAEALARACARLIDDTILRRRLARGAYLRSRQFRWDDVLDTFAADLDTIVGNSGPWMLTNAW